MFGMRTGVPLPPKHQLRMFNTGKGFLVAAIACSDSDYTSDVIVRMVGMTGIAPASLVLSI